MTEKRPNDGRDLDRLYCIAGSDDGRMEHDPAHVYEADIEPYLPDIKEWGNDHDLQIEEWTARPTSDHLPPARQVAECIHEYIGAGEVDEDCYEEYRKACHDPAVVAALQAALDLIASKVTYRMADKLVATHVVTWDVEGCPLLDGEPLYRPAATDRVTDLMAALADSVDRAREAGRRHPEPPAEANP